MGSLVMARLAAPFGMWERHAVEPDEETPQSIRDLYEQWTLCAKVSGRHPKALTFVPIALKHQPSHLALVDLRRGMSQAKYLWAGPGLTRLFGSALTGKSLAQCYHGQTLRDVEAAYERLLNDDKPLFTSRQFRVFNEKLGYDRLILPLMDEFENVGYGMLMIAPKSGIVAASDWRPIAIEVELMSILEQESQINPHALSAGGKAANHDAPPPGAQASPSE
jgi:hypothetical protein